MANRFEKYIAEPQSNNRFARYVEPSEPDFSARQQEDFAKREANSILSLMDSASGKQSPILSVPQIGGQVAGMIGDTGANIIGSVGRTLAPETYKAAQQKLGELIAPIAEDIQPAYEYAKEKAPIMTNTAAGYANMLALGGGLKLAKAEKVGGALEKTAINTLEKAATPKQLAINAQDLRGMAKASYEAASKAGEVFAPEQLSNKFTSIIERSKPKAIGGQMLTTANQRYIKAVDEFLPLKNQPLGIDDVDRIDKELSIKIDEAYTRGEKFDARSLEGVQDEFRDLVSKSEGGKNLSKARELWAKNYKMEDVEAIFRRAENQPNPATAIQTGFRNLAEKARKKGNYTKQEIDLIDKAAKSGLSVDALKLAGSRLIPVIMGASGNPLASAGAYMGGVATRAGATAIQAKKGARVANEITSGITKTAEPTKLNKAAQSILDRIKRGEKVSPAEINKLPAKEGLAVIQEINILPAPEKPAFGAPSAEAMANKQNVLNPTESIYNSPIYMVSPEEKIKEFGRQRLLQAIREKKLKTTKK